MEQQLGDASLPAPQWNSDTLQRQCSRQQVQVAVGSYSAEPTSLSLHQSELTMAPSPCARHIAAAGSGGESTSAHCSP